MPGEEDRDYQNTWDVMMPPHKLAPVHPGEVLREEFLDPMGLSQYRLATDIGVPPGRINQIVCGKRAVTAHTALRLSRDFGTSARFWLNLQTAYDLDVERERGLPMEMPRTASRPQ